VLDPGSIERVLVVMAHPDDVDFSAAGTIAELTDAGIPVTYCLVTDGQAGGFDRSTPRAEIVAIRRAEQTEAAKEVGVVDLVFLGREDGQLVASLALRRELARVIREVRPTVVITQSPLMALDRMPANHPDHRATGEAAIDAVYPDARNPFAFPELLEAGLEPWTVAQVWLVSSGDVNAAVDITEQLERKLRALAAHRSQHRDPEQILQFVRAWNEGNAARFGLPADRAAEVFRVLDTR
jgi:LmbE family N-acetylglucosaminyl deacetylase